MDKKHNELKAIQQELNTTGLSRRNFLDRLAAVGVGFGAAFVLGIRDVKALVAPDAGVNLKSTNPAVDEVLKDKPVDADGDPMQTAQIQMPYARVYRRGPIYGRVYQRYARVYRRY
jgi:hypothetical protein